MKMKETVGNMIRKRAGIGNMLGKRIKNEVKHGKKDRIDDGKIRLERI